MPLIPQQHTAGDQLAIVGDPDQRLLQALHDDDIAAIRQAADRAAAELRANGHPGAAWYVALTLTTTMHNEKCRRESAADEIRVALEGNGHEVMVWHESVLASRGAPPWVASCACAWYAEVDDEQTAMTAAEEHRSQHHGLWGPTWGEGEE